MTAHNPTYMPPSKRGRLLSGNHLATAMVGALALLASSSSILAQGPVAQPTAVPDLFSLSTISPSTMFSIGGAPIAYDFSLRSASPLASPIAPFMLNAQSTPEASTVTQSKPGKDAAPVLVSPTADDMPSSMTTPLLPNIPSNLLLDPLSPGVSKSPSSASPKKPAKDTNASAPTETVQVEDQSEPGPPATSSQSAFFTQQRPFMLFSQDASITYLMPTTLVGHPELSRYVRDFLETRALSEWQALRNPAPQATGQAEHPLGPNLVITGRLEDRFFSSAFSSLYLVEKISLDGKTQPVRVMSFNYSYDKKAPFGLNDIFQGSDEKSLNTTIELIVAYIKTDIVRQKSIRLGTTVRPDQDAWLSNLKPSIDLLQTFTLVPSIIADKIAGLSFHFNPGVLGADTDGAYDVYVPSSIYAGFLSETFAPLFSGDPLMAGQHTAKGFSSARINLEGLKSETELGGNMVIEGEVPANWCDGFHITLSAADDGEIMTEGVVQLLAGLPSYGITNDMLRFRAELSVSGEGIKAGHLTFEPYPVLVKDGRAYLRGSSACDKESPLEVPDPERDSVVIDVIY